MNTQPSNYRNRYVSNSCHVIKSQNELQINRIEYLYEKQRGRLVLLLESDLPLDQEVNAFIKGDHLIIEATRTVGYEKPFRTHLIEREGISDSEQESLKIGFSELKLKPGSNYHIFSCQLISPKLIKVVLSVQSLKNYN